MTDEEMAEEYKETVHRWRDSKGELVQEEDVKQAFIDGYHECEKEHEWHHVKDELPPEDVPLLCVRGGKIYVAWYWDNIYHDSRCCQVKKPYDWKEIVLPELPKEIE
jgi:hypothetical protein